MKHWGKHRALGADCGLLFGAAFFWFPGLGPLLGSLTASIVLLWKVQLSSVDDHVLKLASERVLC